MRNILLGSANSSVLKRWRILLEKENSLEMVTTVREMRDKCNGQVYDLILLHRILVDEEVFRELYRDFPRNKFFILSDQPSEDEGLAYLKIGIAGYGNTYMAPPRLTEAVRIIFVGGVWMGRQILQRLIQDSYNRSKDVSAKDESRLSGLTKAEQRIAERVARGQSNLDIAAELRITERTVKAHLTSIYEKTKTSSRLGLALFINKV
jgi:DNA-binding NarL/FixJ family response regulator